MVPNAKGHHAGQLVNVDGKEQFLGPTRIERFEDDLGLLLCVVEQTDNVWICRARAIDGRQVACALDQHAHEVVSGSSAREETEGIAQHTRGKVFLMIGLVYVESLDELLFEDA